MKFFEILQFPDERLRQKSVEVQKINDELKDYIEKLKLTLFDNKGCVGIAAPQTGVLKRIVIVDVTNHKKATNKNGLLVMINPIFISGTGVLLNREGCLSVPEYTGNVERKNVIKIKYTDLSETEKLLETGGFEAVVLQHEIDHLDGILFLDRISNTKRDLFSRKKY